jgi:hypothetical protein
MNGVNVTAAHRNLPHFTTISWLLIQLFRVISYYIRNACSIHLICFDNMHFKLVLFTFLFHVL